MRLPSSISACIVTELAFEVGYVLVESHSTTSSQRAGIVLICISLYRVRFDRESRVLHSRSLESSNLCCLFTCNSRTATAYSSLPLDTVAYRELCIFAYILDAFCRDMAHIFLVMQSDAETHREKRRLSAIHEKSIHKEERHMALRFESRQTDLVHCHSSARFVYIKARPFFYFRWIKTREKERELRAKRNKKIYTQKSLQPAKAMEKKTNCCCLKKKSFLSLRFIFIFQKNSVCRI